VAALTAAWDGYRTTGVPPLIEKHMSAALTALGAAVSAQQRDAIHRSATEVAHGALDLSLQHRPVWEVDLDRLDLHTRQLMTDAHAGQTGLVRGDTVTLRTIWDRTAHAVAGPGRANIDAQLTALRAAADKGDVTAAAGIGQSLHVALTEVIAAGG
jgi:hypothetical protein